MLSTETRLLRLALMASEAATEPALWPDFMKGYTEAVAADLAVMQIHDLKKRTSTILFGFGITSRFQAAYNEHYAKLNLWREHGRALYLPGRVNLSEEMCPTPLLERSEFYNEFLRPLDGICCMGAVIARQGNQFPNLTANRGRSKPRFGGEERELAHNLLPHLARAWVVQQRLDLLSAGESVLNTLSLGIAILAAGGAPIYQNVAAEEIFRNGDGLSLRNGEICASDRTAEAQIRKAIDHALSLGVVVGPAAVPVPRPSLRRPYQLVAAPFRSRFRQFSGTPAPMAIVLITDPECQPPANTDLLMQLHGLTRKEAAIAARLSEGKSIEQAAEEMAMRYETARTHPRRIFSKTRTSRQAELILLIARLPAARPSRDG